MGKIQLKIIRTKKENKKKEKKRMKECKDVGLTLIRSLNAVYVAVSHQRGRDAARKATQTLMLPLLAGCRSKRQSVLKDMTERTPG